LGNDGRLDTVGTVNDNIPLDESAYGFDGIDPTLLARAKQVLYDVNAQIFAIETDPISVLAKNERTQAPVDANIISECRATGSRSLRRKPR
jgi:hypothetical protein